MTVRVARVITRLNVGGPAYQAVMLSCLLRDVGYETLLIYGRCEQDEVQFDRLLRQFPCDVVFCPHLQRSINPLVDAAAVGEVGRILRGFRPDIVHTHTAKAGVVGRLAGKLCGVKRLVHTFHGHVLDGYFSKPAERAIVAVERALSRITDRLITVSNCLAVDLAERLGLAESAGVAVVELGLPLKRFLTPTPRGHWRRRLGIDDGAIVLGSLGRLVKIKNIARMIDVAARVGAMLPDRQIHLIVGGTGPEEQSLRRQIASAGLGGRVHLVGLVELQAEFYADIDLAILTSDNEGTPVTLLEAQAAGRFVIAPAVGGIPDIVSPGTGIVVTPNVTDAYVAAIRSILSGPTVPAVTDADRTAVVARFSPARLVNDIDSLYNAMLSVGR